MKELVPLELYRCNTVSELTTAMGHCSFGARMLGQVADTVCEWISSQPVIVYGQGYFFHPELVAGARSCRFKIAATSEEYCRLQFPMRNKKVLAVGVFSEADLSILPKQFEDIIFINQYGIAKPGQIRDGLFKNVIFADPRFVMPVLFQVVAERFGNQTPVSFSEFIPNLAKYGGLATEIAHGAETLKQMIKDLKCSVFMTVSGAMTVAKMGLIICDMIDAGWVQYLSTTGALMAHGLVDGIGLKHYEYDPNQSDQVLAEQKLNRVTDTLEPETNFDHIETVMEKVFDRFDGREPISPITLHREIGRHLSVNYPAERGILKSAFERNVPVATPAFYDSELGNDLFTHNRRREQMGRPLLKMDMEVDSGRLIDLAVNSGRLGIFSIGGGVPRNNTQNIGPLIEIINNRLSWKLPEAKFFYGCKIDPTPLYYGNLSGCTYSEGGSWRKIDFNGRFSEIHADATIVLPFLVKYVTEQLS